MGIKNKYATFLAGTVLLGFSVSGMAFVPDKSTCDRVGIATLVAGDSTRARYDCWPRERFNVDFVQRIRALASQMTPEWRAYNQMQDLDAWEARVRAEYGQQ